MKIENNDTHWPILLGTLTAEVKSISLQTLEIRERLHKLADAVSALQARWLVEDARQLEKEKDEISRKELQGKRASYFRWFIGIGIALITSEKIFDFYRHLSGIH